MMYCRCSINSTYIYYYFIGTFMEGCLRKIYQQINLTASTVIHNLTFWGAARTKRDVLSHSMKIRL